MIAAETLRGWIEEAGRRSRQLIAGLSESQLMGPYMPTVNPLRWEIAHAAWFYSYWVLRDELGQEAVRTDEDSLFNSLSIAHSRRWILPLPSLEDTYAYIDEVRSRVLAALDAGMTERALYLTAYSLFHEDMHGEAYTYARQSLGYPMPSLEGCARESSPGAVVGPIDEDAQIPGGTFFLGAERDADFVFDNEKWAHERSVEAFAIARTAVSQGEFAAFVDDGGYGDRNYWTDAGWAWVQHDAREKPRYWRRAEGSRRRAESGWERRHFDTWVELEAAAAMLHVSMYEAEAYCRWAGRRLPTELEWEVAAAGVPDGAGGIARIKRLYPWGDEPPGDAATRGNFDHRALGTIDVGALPESDSAFGCRQMLGNTWEWTSTPIDGYPGFTPDMYDEYSQPWFRSHFALRGGAYSTRGRMIRNTWRTFYTPNRDDVMTGFRTCAL